MFKLKRVIKRILVLSLMAACITGPINVQHGITTVEPQRILEEARKWHLRRAAELLWDVVRPRPETWTAIKTSIGERETANETKNPDSRVPASYSTSRVASATETSTNTAPKPTSPKYGPDGTVLAEFEKQMVELVNQERTKAGLKPLTVDPRLTELARLKCKDMVQHGYFDHYSPTYGQFWDMLKNAGIAYSYCGENLAGNSTVENAHDRLMQSPGHRKNILNPNFTHVGIGIVAYEKYGLLVTQLFLTPK